MQSKERSIQVKQTIVRLQNQNKSIREIAGTLGVAKTTVWFSLRKKERTSELSNIKWPGRPRRTTVVDDRRILSMVKKNPFKPREDHSPGGRRARFDFSKKHLKKPDKFWKSMKHKGKATEKFLKVKKVDYSAMTKSISWSQPDWTCISLAEDKTKGRKTHKRTTTEVSCSRPGKASQKRKPSLWRCPWVPHACKGF